jgi:predicted amidophosphoribosyltransferase
MTSAISSSALTPTSGSSGPPWPRLGARSRWLGLATDVLDLLVPVTCPGCGSDDGAPCVDCARYLTTVMPTVVHTETLSGTPVVAAGRYDDPRMRALLIAHKERGRRGLTTPLAHALADAVVTALDLAAPALPLPRRPVLLVPVPSSRAAVRQRGQDSVAALARRAARVLTAGEVPAIAVPLLVHGRVVRDQVGLSRAQRHQNVHHALVARRPWHRVSVPDHGAIVLIDDVTTSGATIIEGLRALRSAGLHATAAATLASARPDPG